MKGPNIHSIPELEPVPGELDGPGLLKVGDDVSTDEILPAGAGVLPFRSNIPAIARFAFWSLDQAYWDRVQELDGAGHDFRRGARPPEPYQPGIRLSPQWAPRSGRWKG